MMIFCICFILCGSYIAGNQRIFHRQASCVGRLVNITIACLTIIYNTITTFIISPIFDYFPSLSLYDEYVNAYMDGSNNGSNSSNSSTSISNNGNGNGNGNIRASVNEKDLILDIYNNLTGSEDSNQDIETYQGPIPNTFVNMCNGIRG